MSAVAGRSKRPAPAPAPIPIPAPVPAPVPFIQPVSCFRLVTRVPSYTSVKVEPGASFHVHYPDLNSCLFQRNPSAQQTAQCRTVHFGYAIPVLVQASEDRSRAEIVFDGDAPLEPRAAAYLLDHHPDLAGIERSGQIPPPRGSLPSVGAGSLDIAPARPTHPYPPPPPSCPAPPFPPDPGVDCGHQPTAPPRGHHLLKTVNRQSPLSTKLATLTSKSTEIRPHHRSGSQTPLTGDSSPSAAKMPVDPNELYDQLMRQNSAEQDIKAIAKQISDHAEAIYQTWKSKGLTPNELLKLHGTAGESDAAKGSSGAAGGSMQFRQHPAGKADRPKSASNLSPVDLLASPRLEATLEQLVNSFVQEDKARVAARGRQTSPSPVTPVPTSSKASPVGTSSSPIATALKRFEKKGLNYETRSASPGHVTVTKPTTTFHEAVQSAAVVSRPSDNAETVKSRAQKFATRIELANASTGVATWPTKRAHPHAPADKKNPPLVVTQVSYQVAAAPAIVLTPLPTSQVDEEEERLVNALKSGQLIEESRTDDLLVRKLHRSAATAKSGQQAEEELESLVDRLKNLDPQGATPTTLASRETSPHLTHEECPSRSKSPLSVKLSDTVAVTGVSTVDYAKVRFQAAQAYPLTQQRMDDTKSLGKGTNVLQPNVVSETRSRFENSPSRSPPWRSEWSPTRHQTAEAEAAASIPALPDVIDPPVQYSNQNGNSNALAAVNGIVSPEAIRRKSRKLRKSPEPSGSGNGSSSPTSSPLPHPELTVQQRQHLRERNLQQQQQQQSSQAGIPAGTTAGVQYTASGIPIRPFLTRGSVAERVLIFEKCPTAISAESKEKSASSASASTSAEKKVRSNQAPSTSSAWRHTGDVQSRTQVRRCRCCRI